MPKLTRKERNNIYKLALIRSDYFIRIKDVCGLCSILATQLGKLPRFSEYGGIDENYFISKHFPEFDMFCPQGRTDIDIWFKGDQLARSIVLELCILMTRKISRTKKASRYTRKTTTSSTNKGKPQYYGSSKNPMNMN